MKKYYSIILLVSFVIGTLQPILPMLEYHLFEGDITTLLTADGSLTKDTESMCIAVELPDSGSEENDSELLDIDYYPIPVKSNDETGMAILPVRGEQFIFIDNKVISPARDPSSPPPKQS